VSFRIPEEKVQEIRERADIVQVVGERVSLKKAGVRYVGLCPFHQEKTPSFSVHPGMGIFHCFGCGEGGDVISFVMKFEDRPFVDVVKDLAQRFGIPLPVRPVSRGEAAAAERAKDERAQMLKANELAADLYHGLLLNDPSARQAREYLASRRVNSDAIRRFKVGYAPAAWDVTVHFLRRSKVDLGIAAKVGLVQERDRGGYYDRFRDRVIFPIFGAAGEVLGFGGRQLCADDGAKYLNSPESPVFHKGRCLYGLHVAARAARPAGALLVVEGYFDLIALVQSGVENVVATLGTALTSDHIALLRRYVREVLLLFDADEAGVRAAQKSAELLLRGGLSARVVELPRGDDPDSFVLREGAQAFHARVEAAKPIVEFVLEAAAERAEPSPAGKARCVEALKGLLGAVENPVERALYVARIADRLRIPERAVEAALRDTGPAAIAASAAPVPDVQTLLGSPEVRLVGLALSHPELAAPAAAESDLFEPPLANLLLRIAAAHERTERVDVARLLEGTEPALRDRLVLRAFEAEESPEVASRALRDILRSLRERKLRAEAATLQKRLAEAAAQGDQSLVRRLAGERLELERKIRGLSAS
jgi:DNA primase